MSYFECEILKGDTLRDILNIQYNIRSIDDEHSNYIYSRLLEQIQFLNGKVSDFKVSEKNKTSDVSQYQIWMLSLPLYKPKH